MKKLFALIQLSDPPVFVRWVDGPTNCKPGFAIVPRVVEERPAFDPMTERLQETQTVTLEAVTVGVSVLPLSEADAKQAAYVAARSAGYTAPGLGWVLALQENDRNAFTGLLALLNEAVRAGLKTENDTTQIAEQDGTIQTPTIAQFRQIMLGYGSYYSQIWADSK